MTNNNPNASATKTQESQLLAHLLAGGTATPLFALNAWGCERLASRIPDIRNHHGISAMREMVEVGNGKRVKMYWFSAEQIAEYRLANEVAA